MLFYSYLIRAFPFRQQAKIHKPDNIQFYLHIQSFVLINLWIIITMSGNKMKVTGNMESVHY